jgi:translation initiation factor 2 beta subunit (eIF-2beta)/eIF-5
MKERYDRYPELIFIGIIRDGNHDSIEIFKTFVQKCNLSAASKKISVKIITKEYSDNLSNLIV